MYGKRSNSDSDDHNDNEGTKKRNDGDDRGKSLIGPYDTVFRYLCPNEKLMSIMGGRCETLIKLESETNSTIQFGDKVLGCVERVIIIYSTKDKTNKFDGTDQLVCPSQDALFKVHDIVVADEVGPNEVADMAPQVTARLLVSSDQIGCVIGKGGEIVQTIRTETGAQILIMKDNHLPICAFSNDELIQISGEASAVRKALFQIASRLHENPSRSQHRLLPPSIMVSAPPVDTKGESFSKDFSLLLICPSSSVGFANGIDSGLIKDISQKYGASVNVNPPRTWGEDCIISVTAEEISDHIYSPTIEAAICLQMRSNFRDKSDFYSGLISYTTQLLVPSSHVASITGKEGSIISEISRVTHTDIQILSKENLPKVAKHYHDEMVQHLKFQSMKVEIPNGMDILILADMEPMVARRGKVVVILIDHTVVVILQDVAVVMLGFALRMMMVMLT
ncbi:unnamed protein product [Lactuca virosa]|uniref:K Homology domain-containing protein n=1 Tax=Lactuca virosa TaxID=75947 RepID=A0AAU9LB46_9ASTR|nr:unnamed protein product [Lactuca virosa]